MRLASCARRAVDPGAGTMNQDYRALVRDALRPVPARGADRKTDKAGAGPAAAQETVATGQGAGVELQRRVAGINPLLGAANVLLALVPQLRATTSHGDPAGLHRQLLLRVRDFENAARAGGVPPQKVVAARYLLCTFLDEVVAATPWGASGAWARHNLLQEFHDERSGGDKAFKLLERLGEDVATNLDVLELFYVCLALGFEGRFRGKPNGRAQLDAIAARLAEVVRPQGERQAVRTLSLRWTGVSMRRSRVLAVVPLWAVLAAGGALVLGTWLALNNRLNELARPAFQQVAAAPLALLPREQNDGAAAGPARARLARPLAGDVAAGTIQVRDEPLRSLVTLASDSLFAPGSAQIEPAREALLARVAQALAASAGQVTVIGHTDDTPVSSVRFPSSWHLTRAQAQSVANVLERHGVAAERVHAEGRADADPRGPNSSAQARARNRRVEIVLQLPRPEAADEAAAPSSPR